MGQLVMGYAGDVLGRNKAMKLTLSLVVIGALLSALAPFGSSVAIYCVIIATRFILGVGVGGVYPLAATKAAEDGGKNDGVNVTAAAWAFVWQVPGTMAPWITAYILTYSGLSTSFKWRLLLGLGAVPAALVVLCSMLETHYRQELELTNSAPLLTTDNPMGSDSSTWEHHGLVSYDEDTADIAANAITTTTRNPLTVTSNSGRVIVGSSSSISGSLENSVDNPPRRDSTTAAAIETGHTITAMFQNRDTWRKLAITGGCWFIYDVAYYGVNLFGGEILKEISDRDDDNVSLNSAIRRIAVKQVIAAR